MCFGSGLNRDAICERLQNILEPLTPRWVDPEIMWPVLSGQECSIATTAQDRQERFPLAMAAWRELLLVQGTSGQQRFWRWVLYFHTYIELLDFLRRAHYSSSWMSNRERRSGRIFDRSVQDLTTGIPYYIPYVFVFHITCLKLFNCFIGRLQRQKKKRSLNGFPDDGIIV